MASQQKIDAFISWLHANAGSGWDEDALRSQLANVPDNRMDALQQSIASGDLSAGSVQSNVSRETSAASDAAWKKGPLAGVKALDQVSREDRQKVLDWFNSVPSNEQGKVRVYLEQNADASSPGTLGVGPLLDAAKKYHFDHVMSDAEKAKTLPQDAASYAFGGSVPGGLNTDNLNAYLNTLPADKKWQAVQQLKQKFEDATWRFGPFGRTGSAVNQKNLDDVLGGLVKAYGGKVPTPQQQAAQSGQSGQPGQSSTSSAAAINPAALQVTPGAGVSDYQKQQYELITGQNFNDAYAAFSQQYAIAVQQQATDTSRMSGQEQIWTGGQYNAPSSPWKFADPVAQSSIKDNTGQYKPSEEQFFGYQANTELQVAAAVENQLRAKWTMKYGSGVPFPDTLAAAVWQNVSTMKADDLYNLVTQSGGTAGAAQGMLTSGSTLDLAFQQAGQQAESQKGSAPIPGMSLTNYNNAQSWATPLFNQKMGRDPTAKELAMFNGWSQDDISRWVESQPSKASDGKGGFMTIGQRDSNLSTADAISQKLYGTNADDRMLANLAPQLNAPKGATP